VTGTVQQRQSSGQETSVAVQSSPADPRIVPALEVLCGCGREEFNRSVCEKPPGAERRKPHSAGLVKTRKREARFLPSAYFEDITLSPNFQKHLTIWTSKYPSCCVSVLQAPYPPPSLCPAHLTVTPKCMLCQSRQGDVGQATQHGIGTRYQKMSNPLW